MGEIRDSLDVIVAAINGTKIVFSGIWEFLKDPFLFLKTVADPAFLIIVGVLLLLKAIGFDTNKYTVVAFLVYIFILIF